MTFIKSWEDFERAAEKLYLANPMKVSRILLVSIHLFDTVVKISFEILFYDFFLQVRYTMKYRHSDGALILKFTDDAVVRRKKSDWDCIPQIHG